jgi:Polysaccharide lyase
VKRGLILVVLFAAMVALTTPAQAAVPVGAHLVFTGDFETGNFGQWSQCQNRRYSGSCKGRNVQFYGMQVVGGSARQGQYAARFEVRNGDQPSWGGGERSEVARYDQGRVHEGDERWYEFSLMFDPAFPVVTGKYFIVMQWHGPDNEPPPMALEVQGAGQLVLTGHGTQAPLMVVGDIARGQWVDYVVHARFSRSSATGWTEVFRDGVLAVPRHPRANLSGHSDYFKMGIYRDVRATSTAVMWADGLRITGP